MTGMKNGAQKSTSKGFLKPIYSKVIGEFRERHRNDMSRLCAIIIIGLLCSVIIQETLLLDRFIGSFLLATLLLYIFYRDIQRYKPGYLEDYKMLLLLGGLVTGSLFMGRLFEYILAGLSKGLNLAGSNVFIYGIPISIGAMLVTLIFDFHSAIIFSFIISILTGVWLNTPLYSIYSFMGSLTAAFSVIRCKKRSALIKGGFYVSAVSMLTVLIILLLEGTLFTAGAPAAFMFAAISGFMVASLVSILLPVIEYLFGITTDISLIEFLDLDQPLMRNLMIAAPGTYHHSIIVGNLAESASEAVGANPLLARVAAYYHDIGKMKIPEYFVENQTASVSRHEKLAPHMSSMVIVSHVKEGVDLARQYKLPNLVTDVIQQHHGTSLITYFYQKAMEQSSSPIPVQDNFRYPGPRPRTRVAAIVMMADAVEAASRALTDPTPARISALVERIINNIFLDGQIDDCELTLKDISEIKKRFVYIITSIFHKRIEYPEIKIGKETVLHGSSSQEDRYGEHQSGSGHTEA